MLSHSTGMPSAGTSRASMPRCVPSQTMSNPRRLRTRAVASAGNTCPPVPPAITSATLRFMCGGPRATDLAAGRLGVVVDAQQHADPAERDQHAAAAVGEQRQGQALRRQQAHVHADVHERLQAEPDADGGREVRLEGLPCFRRIARDLERPADEHGEQADHHDHADEAELLGEHREHEIGVRLGQVEQLLHARAEADAEPLAAADRDQRLHELEAAVERVAPGIEEARQAAQAVRRQAPRARPAPSCRARRARAR